MHTLFEIKMKLAKQRDDTEDAHKQMLDTLSIYDDPQIFIPLRQYFVFSVTGTSFEGYGG